VTVFLSEGIADQLPEGPEKKGSEPIDKLCPAKEFKKYWRNGDGKATNTFTSVEDRELIINRNFNTGTIDEHLKKTMYDQIKGGNIR
jgi:hypothetical protein